MTKENLFVADLQDIRSILVVCPACNTRLAFPIAKAENPPYSCPGCRKPWRIEGENWDNSDYTKFVKGIAGLIEGGGKAFNVMLEFDRSSVEDK